MCPYIGKGCSCSVYSEFPLWEASSGQWQRCLSASHADRLSFVRELNFYVIERKQFLFKKLPVVGNRRKQKITLTESKVKNTLIVMFGSER